MSEIGVNALQQMEILNLGQLLNLVTNVTKVKIRLKKLQKSLIGNAYGIILNRTRTDPAGRNKESAVTDSGHQIMALDGSCKVR